MNKILLVFLGLLVATVCNAQPSSGSGPTGGGAGGGLASLVSDTSPQLGGFLDVQTHGITNNAEGIGIALKTTELSFFGTADFSMSTNLVVGHGSDAVQIRGVSGSNNGIIDHPLDTGDLKIRSFESGDTSGDLYLNDVAGGDVFIGATANTDAVTIYGTLTLGGSVLASGINSATSDDDFVTLAGSQTISGNKTFTGQTILTDAIVIAANSAMASTNIDWTVARNTITLTGSTAFDLDAAGSAATGNHTKLVVAAGASDRVITFDQNVIDISNDVTLSAGSTRTIKANANAEITLIYDGTNYRAIGLPEYLVTESETFTILEPDAVQGVSDVLLLKHFPSERYPYGVTMVSVHIGAASTYTSETFTIEESALPTGASPSTVEAITLTAATSAEDDGTFTDGAIANDAYIFVNFDDTPEDIAFIAITLTYQYQP